MSLWQIAWRSIRERRLSSLLTMLSMALGVTLVVAVLVVMGVVQSTFTRSAQGYHLIVGAKGGKLQLVLNTVYHLSQPIENLPYDFYKEFTEGRYSSVVRVAIPYCLGDNYEGFRVVGTIPEMFEQLNYGQGEAYRFADGRNFEQEHFFEAVVGSVVAAQTGLKVGSSFEPTHGVTGDDGHKHDAFKVVGILAPTGTPNDRAVFVNMEGFYLLEGHALTEPRESDDHAHEDHDHGDDHSTEESADEPPPEAEITPGDGSGGDEGDGEHDHADHDDHDHSGHDHAHGHGHDHHHEPLAEELREVTAILLLLDSDLSQLSLITAVNEGNVAQAVMPAREVQNLIQGIIGPLRLLLLVLAVLVVVVAGVGIMVSIYNSMNDRRREIAVMRALGASRGKVMWIILLESIILSLCGGAFGLLLGHGLIGLASPFLAARTGVSIGFLQFQWIELALVPGLMLVASIVGYLPALTAYRTDVAGALSNSP